jgi:hypothetical protein
MKPATAVGAGVAASTGAAGGASESASADASVAADYPLAFAMLLHYYHDARGRSMTLLILCFPILPTFYIMLFLSITYYNSSTLPVLSWRNMFEDPARQFSKSFATAGKTGGLTSLCGSRTGAVLGFVVWCRFFLRVNSSASAASSHNQVIKARTCGSIYNVWRHNITVNVSAGMSTRDVFCSFVCCCARLCVRCAL